jgi:hypothetical protein
MAIDMRRVVLAAVQAALEEPDPGAGRQKKKKKKRLSGGRAVLIGAGLMTAGRLAASGRGRGMLESLQQRLVDEDDPDDGAAEEEYLDAEADEEFDEEFDEDPEAEAEEPADEEAEAPEVEEPADEEEAGRSGRRRGRTRAQR